MNRYAIELAGEGPELDQVHQLLDRFVAELRARGHLVRRAVCSGHTFHPPAVAAAIADGITVRPVIHDATATAIPTGELQP